MARMQFSPWWYTFEFGWCSSDFPNFHGRRVLSSKQSEMERVGVSRYCRHIWLVNDIARIKVDADSGFVAFAAAAYFTLSNMIWSHCCEQKDLQKTSWHFDRYSEATRNELAVEPNAGFFTLWKFQNSIGTQVETTEHFNRLMIENTGVVGVHFNRAIFVMRWPVDILASGSWNWKVLH